MSSIGFTGTRNGLTEAQLFKLRILLSQCSGTFHHGDCIGADAQAAEIANLLGYYIIVHPPTDSKHRAFAPYNYGHTLPALDYLARNQEIVKACDYLIAAPNGSEKRRSGTWATIRYCKTMQVPRKIIWPHGLIEST